MALLEGNSNSIIAKKVCIGVNRYSSPRGKAMYMNCLDSYPESEDQSGEFQAQIRADYNDFNQFLSNKPSFHNPVVVTMEGRFQVFQGSQSFVCDRVISVSSYKQAAVVTKPSDNKTSDIK